MKKKIYNLILSIKFFSPNSRLKMLFYGENFELNLADQNKFCDFKKKLLSFKFYKTTFLWE